MKLVYEEDHPGLEVIRMNRAILMRWPLKGTRPNIRLLPEESILGVDLPGTLDTMEFYSSKDCLLVVF